MKIMCSEDDCYEMLDTEYDYVMMADGKPHPLSTKCYDCRTDEDNKKLKNYSKHRRQALNKLLRTNPK